MTLNRAIPGFVRQNFKDFVSMGKVNGWEAELKFAHSENIGTSEVGMAPGAWVFNWLDAPTLIQLSSSDVDDVNGNGGADKITVFGLGADGLEQEEQISLNGQTPVTSTKQFGRINRMRVTDGDLNIGDIWSSPNGATLNSGVPEDSDKLYQIAAGEGQSTQMQYTVPGNKWAYVYNINLGLGGDRTTTFWLRVMTPQDTCFRIAGKVALYRSAINYPWSPRPIPPLTDIMITCKTNQPTSDVAATIEFLLEEEV